MLELLILAVVVFGSITLYIYYYLACLFRNSYFKRRGIPGPEGEVVYGNLRPLIDPNYPSILQKRDWTKQYGKVYGIREGWRYNLIISDPDLLQELFLKKFEYFHGRKLNPIVGNVDKEARVHVFDARGARWRRLRNISSPNFSVGNLKKIMPTVDDSVKELMKHLRKAAEKDQHFNIHPYCHELTMDVICRVAMGQRGSRQFKNPIVDVAKRVFAEFAISPINVLCNLFPWEWSTAIIRKFLDLLKLLKKSPLDELVEKLYIEVNERKKLRAAGQVIQEGDHVDFIDLFLDAESEEISDETSDFSKGVIKVSKRLTTDEIVGQCFVFLLAGFDTTANTLASMCYFLAKNPEKQQLLQSEIDEICPNEDVTYDQLQSLKYADAAMKETLRLVPVASFTSSRECMKTAKLGDLTIEKGTLVQADVFSVHYDPEIWGDDAENFVPERWFDDVKRHSMSWMGFGAGPRTCIGMRLAQMEDKLALVRILREYNIFECAETEKELKLVGPTVLNPESVTVKLVKRN